MQRHLKSTMLIADDDHLIASMIACHCSSLGFEVETAGTGLEALASASKVQPDIVVLDVCMPELDGLSVCARLLKWKDRPANVVIITSNRDDVTVQRCDDLAVHYVHKGPDFFLTLISTLKAIGIMQPRN